jgi:hypothetical protein
MKTAFANSLSRAFSKAVETFGSSVLLNGESVNVVISESEYMTLPEEGGVNPGGELQVKIARSVFEEFGKTGDPRRNQFTINGMKYRVATIMDTPENPILTMEVRQDR